MWNRSSYKVSKNTSHGVCTDIRGIALRPVIVVSSLYCCVLLWLLFVYRVIRDRYELRCELNQILLLIIKVVA